MSFGLFPAVKSIFVDKINYLILYPTSKCNAECPHCYNSERILSSLKNTSNELLLEEYEYFSKNLPSFYSLAISGGEPTLRTDVTEICSLFAKNNKVRYIDFHSNGYLDHKLEKMTYKILHDNPDIFLSVCLSVDKLHEDHDSYRKLKGSFKRVMESINRLKKLKDKFPGRLSIKTATVFCKGTEDTCLETLNYLSSLGVENALAYVRGKTWDNEQRNVDVERYYQIALENDKQKPEHSFFSMNNLTQLVSSMQFEIIKQIEISQKRLFRCRAGKSIFVVWENGDISPCELKDISFGNLRDYNYSLEKMLAQKKNQGILYNIEKNKCFCTWENALTVNCLRSIQFYPKLIKKALSAASTRLHCKF